MSLKIRLTRGGAKKRPYYRIVVADARSPRDGRFIDKVGAYDPMKAKDHPARVVLDNEKIQSWLAKGAQPDRSRPALPRPGRSRQAPDPQQPAEGRAGRQVQGAGRQARREGRRPRRGRRRVRSRLMARRPAGPPSRDGGRRGRPPALAPEVATSAKPPAPKPPAPPADPDLVLMGEFGRAHGLNGEVRLKSFTADPRASPVIIR